VNEKCQQFLGFPRHFPDILRLNLTLTIHLQLDFENPLIIMRVNAYSTLRNLVGRTNRVCAWQSKYLSSGKMDRMTRMINHVFKSDRILMLKSLIWFMTVSV